MKTNLNPIIVGLYTLQDKVRVRMYDPFIAENDLDANRKKENLLSKVSESQKGDFELYCLGTFNVREPLSFGEYMHPYLVTFEHLVKEDVSRLNDRLSEQAIEKTELYVREGE